MFLVHKDDGINQLINNANTGCQLRIIINALNHKCRQLRYSGGGYHNE